MRRGFVVALGTAAILIGGTFLTGGSKRPLLREDQTKVTKFAKGAEAQAFVDQWAATHPSFGKIQADSEAFWTAKGKTKQPPIVVQVAVKQEPGLIRRMLGHVWPKLSADTWSNDQGVIITTPYSGLDSDTWNGNVYAYINATTEDIAADATIDASGDYIGDANWVGNDRGTFHDRTVRQACLTGPQGLFVRAAQAIWPSLGAICACNTVCNGQLTACALRNALGRARVQCGLAAAGCTRQHAVVYLECLSFICEAAVYVDFFDELYAYGSFCGWLDPCRA